VTGQVARLQFVSQVASVAQGHEVQREPLPVGVPGELDQWLLHAAHLHSLQDHVSDAEEVTGVGFVEHVRGSLIK
jgi:hypothetical protein